MSSSPGLFKVFHLVTGSCSVAQVGHKLANLLLQASRVLKLQSAKLLPHLTFSPSFSFNQQLTVWKSILLTETHDRLVHSVLRWASTADL